MKRMCGYLLALTLLLTSIPVFANSIKGSFNTSAPVNNAFSNMKNVIRQSGKGALAKAPQLRAASGGTTKSDRHLYKTGYIYSSSQPNIGRFTINQPALVLWEISFTGKNLLYGIGDSDTGDILSMCPDVSDFSGAPKVSGVYLHPGEYYMLLGYNGYSGSFRYDIYIDNITTTVGELNKWSDPTPISIDASVTGLISATNNEDYFKFDMPYNDAVTLTVSSEANYTGYGVINSDGEYIDVYTKVPFNGQYKAPETRTLSVYAQKGINYIGILKGKCTDVENIIYSVLYQGRYTASVMVGPKSIQIKWPIGVLSPNETVQLTTTVVPDVAAKEFIWSSSNPSVATVSDTGLVTSYTLGTTNITATARNGCSDTLRLTVSPKRIQAITLNLPAGTRLAVGSPLKINATIYPEEATNQKLAWASSKPKVIAVSSEGILTAYKKGSATITATAQDGTQVSAKIKVNAIMPMASITIKGKDTVKSGKNSKYVAKAFPTSASIKKVTWMTSDPAIAVISPKGVLKVAPNTAGKTVTITATATDGSGIRADKVITII